MFEVINLLGSLLWFLDTPQVFVSQVPSCTAPPQLL